MSCANTNARSNDASDWSRTTSPSNGNSTPVRPRRWRRRLPAWTASGFAPSCLTTCAARWSGWRRAIRRKRLPRSWASPSARSTATSASCGSDLWNSSDMTPENRGFVSLIIAVAPKRAAQTTHRRFRMMRRQKILGVVALSLAVANLVALPDTLNAVAALRGGGGSDGSRDE